MVLCRKGIRMKKAVVIIDGLFVYLVVCLLAMIISDTGSIDIVDCMKIALYSGAFLGVITLIWMIVNCLKTCRIGPREAVSLAKVQMIMRFIQIPGYIAIFLLGVLLFFSLFGAVFAMILAFVDVISIALTGIASISVYVHLLKNNLITKTEFIIFSVLSFIYVIDVVAAAICYNKVKKRVM